MSFLGPEGVADRMAQIESRLSRLSPSTPQAGVAFGKALQGALGGQPPVDGPVDPIAGGFHPLSGPIGGKPELRAMAEQAAMRNGLDPKLFDALVEQESDWDARAQSGAGAKGLCQLMDGTADDLGVSDAFDPRQSLEGGARYLRRMIDANHGDVRRALAAYNAGSNRIKGRAEGAWPRETQRYVAKILADASGSRT